MRFALIDAEKAEFPVRTMCRVMDVSESGFFAWKGRPASQRQRDDMIYLAHIRTAFVLSNRTYGSPRMHHELVDEGLAHRTPPDSPPDARERPGRAPEASFQTNHGQHARLADRAQPAGPGLCGRGAGPEMERQYPRPSLPCHDTEVLQSVSDAGGRPELPVGAERNPRNGTAAIARAV